MSEKYFLPKDRAMAIFTAAVLAASLGYLVGIITGKKDTEKVAREWCQVWREPTDSDYVKPYNDDLF